MITCKKEVHFFYFSPLFRKKRNISPLPPRTPYSLSVQDPLHSSISSFHFEKQEPSSLSQEPELQTTGRTRRLQQLVTASKAFLHRHEIHGSLMLRYSQREHYRDLWTSQSQEKLSHTSPGVSLSFSSQDQLPRPLSPRDHLFCTSEQTAQFVCYFPTNRSPFLPDSLFLFTFKGSDHHHFLNCIRFPA